jgi:hypothetical protein
MPAPCYQAWNQATGALTTFAAFQSSGTSITQARTMMQLAPASSTALRPVEWGYLFSAAESAAPATIELIDTGTVPATGLTAHVAAGIHKVNVPTGAASTVQLGTGLTGYAAGAPTEGTITATRLIDMRQENGIWAQKQYPLGREWEIPASNFLRVRLTPGTTTAISFLCYVTWEE